MALDVAARTDTGRCRAFNEDTFSITVPGAAEYRGPPRQRLELGGLVLLGVYDGHGRLATGETGSGLVARAVHEHFAARAFAPDELADTLAQALQTAGRRLFELGEGDRRYRGIGTTATVAAFCEGRLTIAHAGDTRAYLLRDGQLAQLSRDDSLANDLRDAGLPAALDVHASVITKALGITADVAPSLYRADLADGDLVLLCSDGVSSMLGGDALEEIVRGQADPGALCDALVEAAERAGGHDNETAIAARVRLSSRASRAA